MPSRKRKFKGMKETDPAWRAYRVSSYAAIGRLCGKEIWKAPYGHRTEDMTVGKIRALGVPFMLLLKAYRDVLWVHRSKIALFYVGNHPTGNGEAPIPLASRSGLLRSTAVWRHKQIRI
jgi:hypothetical protein